MQRMVSSIGYIDGAPGLGNDPRCAAKSSALDHGIGEKDILAAGGLSIHEGDALHCSPHGNAGQAHTRLYFDVLMMPKPTRGRHPRPPTIVTHLFSGGFTNPNARKPS